MKDNAYEVDQYIASFPAPVMIQLEALRSIIIKIIPDATECISYGIPTYRRKKNIVHFGGFKNHVSLFPTASGVKAFEKELTRYKTSKGAIQFSLDEKLPTALIQKIVRFRNKEVG